MFRAVTVIELLITLAITVIAGFYFSPTLFRLHDQFVVAQEVENVKSFLYGIQDKARFQNQNYALTIAQNEQGWCIVALAKKRGKQTACNCLTLASCDLNDAEYRLYRNQNAVSIYNKKLFPSILTYVDGKSGNQSSLCLGISKGQSQAILQIQRNGVINVIDQKARSQCKESS